ncbi:hypothetical protein KIN20_025620 [Parelaphostrongylus tenuis]|uniref:Uncharacterized protein n=1 Tax=Parelaphostrongylus tenuis TaxID=148309 RepID=A0AAD5MYN7_PARTN|nr:hypothetical protein KIN20_025620 [Parelaphostrongylus tenuis]
MKRYRSATRTGLAFGASVYRNHPNEAQRYGSSNLNPPRSAACVSSVARRRVSVHFHIENTRALSNANENLVKKNAGGKDAQQQLARRPALRDQRNLAVRRSYKIFHYKIATWLFFARNDSCDVL